MVSGKRKEVRMKQFIQYFVYAAIVVIGVEGFFLIADGDIHDTPITNTPITDTPITNTPITNTPITNTPITDTPIEVNPD